MLHLEYDMLNCQSEDHCSIMSSWFWRFECSVLEKELYSLTLGLLGGGGYHPPPPLAFFPYYFFDDSNWKNCFSVSVTRDRRHILAYVTSSWRCHVTYVMTSTVHDNRRKHRCFTIVRLSRYLSKYLWYGNEVGVVSNIFEVKEFKNVEIIYMTLTDDLEIQGQTSLKLTFNY